MLIVLYLRGFFSQVYSDCCLPILFSENILVFVLMYRSWFTLTNSLCGMFQGLNYVFLHKAMAIVFFYHHLRHSLLSLSHNSCMLKCPYSSQNRTWVPLGELIELSLFLHFQLSDWHNCKLGSEEINLSLLYFAGPSAGYCFFFFSAFRNNSEFTLPFLFSIYYIFRGFQKILHLDSYLYIAIIQRENFSFFYPISLLLISTAQILQNLCLLSLMFDAQFSLAMYNTHPLLLSASKRHFTYTIF